MATQKYCFLDLTKGEWGFDIPENYNVTEKPCEVIDTKLSDILESNVDPKYYLSAKACEGILRRAEQRGKKLPDVLRNALKNQIAISQNQREEVRDIGDKSTCLNGANGTHQQTFIAYKKTAHPRNAEEGQGYEETEVNDTLNTFDMGETRTPTIIADSVEPGVASREGGHYYEGVSGTLRAQAGDNQMSVVYGADQYNGEVSEEQSGSLGTNCGASSGRQSVINVEMEVAVRKYEVDTEGLIKTLQKAKGQRNVAQIAEDLNKPKTLVAHWFRTDDYFSVPDPESWRALKEYLKIETDEFDKSITTIEYKAGNYDKRNRIYTGEVSPTLTAENSNMHLVEEAYGVYTKGNGDAYIEKETHGTVNTGGGQAGQGYPCVCEKAATITAAYGTKWNGNSGAFNGENFVINDQGGESVNVEKEEKSPTLRAQDHGHPPVVAIDRYNQECSDIAPSLKTVQGGDDIHAVAQPIDQQGCYWNGEQTCGTLTANNAGGAQRMPDKENFNCVCIENHPSDSRVKISKDGKVQTLPARMGMGGGNCPMVMEAYSTTTGSYMKSEKEVASCLQARDFKDPQCVAYGVDQQGGKGSANYEEEKIPTMCSDSHGTPHAVAYGICSKDSNSMKSDNPDSGFYEAETSRTLDLNGGNPACNQGGIAVVEGNGARPSHKGDGYKESETMYTLNTTEQHAVAFGNYQFSGYKETEKGETIKSNGGTNGGGSETLVSEMIKANNENAEHQQDLLQSSEERARSLAAGTHGSAPHLTKTVVNELGQYFIRRLTPTECLKLMGLPADWCNNLSDENPSEEEIEKWAEIFETHRRVISHNKKPKTRNQIIKFLKNPWSDGAVYKMAGNGLVIQCAEYVLGGIAGGKGLVTDKEEQLTIIPSTMGK